MNWLTFGDGGWTAPQTALVLFTFIIGVILGFYLDLFGIVYRAIFAPPTSQDRTNTEPYDMINTIVRIPNLKCFSITAEAILVGSPALLNDHPMDDSKKTLIPMALIISSSLTAVGDIGYIDTYEYVAIQKSLKYSYLTV